MMSEIVRKYDLEERLIEFAVLIIKITESIQHSKAGVHLGGHLVRSGTSPALHYGEAQSAESRNDFIHKVKILLKELSETLACLKIIKKSNLLNEDEAINVAMKECNELISIFMKSVSTAKKNAADNKLKRGK